VRYHTVNWGVLGVVFGDFEVEGQMVLGDFSECMQNELYKTKLEFRKMEKRLLNLGTIKGT
jgi:hypothetical protein